MKPVQTRLGRELFEPSSEKPVLPRQLFLVDRMLPLPFLQTLDKTLGLGQETQRGVSRSLRAQWYKYLQLFEAISEVCSSIFLQLVMSRPAAL